MRDQKDDLGVWEAGVGRKKSLPDSGRHGVRRNTSREGIEVDKTHEEEEWSQRLREKNALQRLKQQTENRNLQSCGSRKHGRFERGEKWDVAASCCQS